MRFCPYCGGDLAPHLAAARIHVATPATSATRGKYDQDEIWKALIAEAATKKATPPSTMSLVTNALEALELGDGGFDTIVHLVFDREIVPRGGVLHKATLLEGRTQLNPSMLEAMGYAVHDNHAVIVNDVPVGKAYLVLDYWGGEKQHPRWHMSAPVKVETSRNGNPFFMDETMIGFGASWRDKTKLSEALVMLCETFITGVSGDGCVAIPLALQVTVQ